LAAQAIEAFVLVVEMEEDIGVGVCAFTEAGEDSGCDSEKEFADLICFFLKKVWKRKNGADDRGDQNSNKMIRRGLNRRWEEMMCAIVVEKAASVFKKVSV
jgi:hypothetical protein